MPVAATALFWFLRKRTGVSRLGNKPWQLIVGITFGAIAIYGTEAGIPLDGAMMNVRDAAPLAAGLLFGGPAGIIAGVIGGVERWVSVLWGVGEYTRLACSLGTIFAGVYAALLRKYMFDNRAPSWLMALATGTVVEVLHLMLVFLTNLDTTERAVEVVQACVFPMVGCVSISVALSTMALALLNKQRAFTPRDKRGVAQIVQSWILVAIVAAFATSVGFMSLAETNLSARNAASLLGLNVHDVKQDIVDASDRNLLDIAHKAALEIPSVASASDELCARLAEELDVTEVHVIDKQGIIVATNIELFKGFDMASGAQSAEFLKLLPGGGAIEYAQSYQPRAYDEKAWNKYAGVAIAGGILQVGYDSDNFLNELYSKVSTSVRNRHVGRTGGLIVVDEDGRIISSGNLLTESILNDVASEDAERAGEGVVFTTTFGGTECFAMYEEVEGYYVSALLPVEEANASRDAAVLIISMMEILIFAALFMVLYFAIKHVVVRSIWQVNGRLGEITKGDLDVEVDVRESIEFSSLSDDINKTVGVLKDSLEAVQADLDMAAEIQANSLPSMTPEIEAHTEFELHASMNPAKEVGGDFYDYFLVDDDHLAVAVADVSGKGIPAALFMMLSKTVIKMEALSGLAPDKVLDRANADLSEKNDDDMFTTVWLGVLEISTGKLVYADAGHEKLAIYRDGEWSLPPKPNGAVALAAFSQEDYVTLPEKYHFRLCEVQLMPGDALFQYSDGVTEANDENEDLFGEDRLLQALNDAKSPSPEDVLPFVKERIDEFVGDVAQFDDITMLGLRYMGK